MTSSVKVLSFWRSPFGVRVLIALKEKGVEYEYIEEQDLLETKSKLLLESNPVHKKVPVLIHNGKPVCESLIILQYIDETWPSHDNNGFLPPDPYERAVVRFWADYADKKIFEAIRLILKNAEGELVEQGKKIMKESMATLDKALKDVARDGPYFGGKNINLVDITLASYLCWIETLETLGNFKSLEESTCPHLCEWAKVVVQHPSVKEGLATIPAQKVLESARELRKKYFGILE
ncbi:hypothetical protein GOP47_0012912 [Adiantum capillus-veneris]|uniref:glutathione transferase n=1 Tax=Adiantum capillus-veneris TaxID=13818 RepID=A0A9D4ZH92_ADICA|nr:hypothetical protein GOP47_0012912 [Adiantum capillus-veneris]